MMQRKRVFPLLILVFGLFISCNSKPSQHSEEGKIDAQTYHSDLVGWSMPLPENWTLIDLKQQNETLEKGRKAMEETTGQPIATSNLIQLLALEKDPYNKFFATAEPFKEEKPGDWNAYNQGLNYIIYQTFADQGIRADTAAIRSVKIDGLEFRQSHFTIYDPEGAVLMEQDMFSRLHRGHDLGVTLSYNAPEHRDALMKSWEASTFEKE
jgi:hypothetical protein